MRLLRHVGRSSLSPQRRLGQTVVRAVVALARAADKRRVTLHVVSDNVAARALYEREGFVATGHSIPHTHVDQLTEVEMELVVEDGLGSPFRR